ncbi:alpha/beta hydrolase [Methylobacterium sp. DB0501]|uniref:alpha/beta hydrolase n=1 Tax=Methylobacterium sp. DB0501 TaxID=2709665 RepID=UPI0013EE1D89|nr:alpha/beta hydrolase [Methylobacterium sp. DB0501]NGM33188.1 alpha/beta hydrolase [Methylobacterium sp. DB0501]
MGVLVRGRSLGILLVAIGLGACAGTPKGVLAPVAATVPGASKVDMLVATTRKTAANPGEMYSGDRGPALSYADITVSIPPDAIRQPGTVQWPKELPGNPATDFVTLKAETLERPEAAARLRRSAARTGKRNVLVFVHGFNNRFEDAVYRFAQIVHDTRADVVPVLFTWPSRGSVLAYGYDRESTNYSRNALEGVLRRLAQNPEVGEITVLAHSMGNWLVLESLRQMAIRDGKVAPKIRDVVLAAPDVDVDLAREAFRDMGPGRPRLSLFVSQDDNALAVSRLVWGSSGARLGAIDPSTEPYRSELARENIAVLNLTAMKGEDALNHGKFAGSPQLVALLGNRLAQGQTITDSRVGLSDRIVQMTAGAAATVGTAAGLAVSAPVAVVDAQSRETYGEHLRNLGQGIGDTAEGAVDLATAPARALGGR